VAVLQLYLRRFSLDADKDVEHCGSCTSTMSVLVKKCFHQIFIHLACFYIGSWGSAACEICYDSPLYYKYPLDEAQLLKDFIANLATF
jgi:hypothetical protein